MYKPILFNTEMVKAILDGRKTQTRRIIKPQPTNPRWNNVGWLGWDDGHGYRMKPPCEVDDLLWIRETWCDPDLDSVYSPILYKADFPMHFAADQTEHGETVDITADEFKWHPSIHMPKEAARIFLRVKDVRAERLQTIDGYGILAEGVDNGASNPAMGKRWENMQRDAFEKLWNSTIKRDDIGLYGWRANPWVWVIEFERCEMPADF